ncbi:MAG: UbiA family prenyltransferase [Chitinophagales bacterium]|nr:UbiA family prenyltransferase [Chitinophagales bacterium]
MGILANKPIADFQGNVRLKSWWAYKTAPLLGLLYLMVYVNRIPVTESIYLFIASIITIVGIAGLGYFLNDLGDIAFDKKVGKPNRVAKLSNVQRVGLALILLLFALLPWLYLKSNWLTWLLLAFQMLLYIIYSFHPFRFKEKGILGIICDTLYGLTVPALIALLTFNKTPAQSHFAHFGSFLAVVFMALSIKGIRNILLHQLEDRRNDRRAGIRTFVSAGRPLRILMFLNRFILPLEGLVLIVLVAVVSINVRHFYLVLLAFSCFYYLRFRAWSFYDLPYRQFWFMFIYFLNDFFEDWLPLAAVIYLVTLSPYFLILLVLHFVLFNSIIKKWLIDVKAIWLNLTT